jgi:hypothetical protein
LYQKKKIECDFERLDGYLFLGPGEDKKTLYKELEATHRVGLKTELILKSQLTSFDIGTCLRFPNQAQFHLYCDWRFWQRDDPWNNRWNSII